MGAQIGFDFGATDAARKRAGKLSERAAMVIGAASCANGLSYHYKGFLGFTLDCGDIIWIGACGAVRRTRGIAGSPRRFHARPDLAARLERMGRRAVIFANLKPADYRHIVGRRAALYASKAECEVRGIRATVDAVLGEQA